LENGGEHRIDLGQVRAYVMAFLERDELRSRDLAHRYSALVVEFSIPGPCQYETSDLLRPKVLGDRAFNQHRVRRRLDGRGSLSRYSAR
jgi:hypothetical protein